ncbi:MAG: hypothetical protein A2076_04630 [Geobacteraceae bacterium GWC2_53_11]|nr:MAG: hypothetical protein A2076_04630 [Geobacteraceae bacterium GWC2_53_11]
MKKTYSDASEETFTYDAKGNMLTASNKDIAYNFSYDAAGRMTSSTDSNGRYLQYSYDTTGKKTKTIYPEGSVVSYSYDGTGRLATITNGGGRTYGYSYDKLGRRSKLTYPSGATANYAYDAAGRLTSLEHKQSNGRIIASFAYTHDNVGNRMTKTEPDGRTSYGYDAIYRLLTAQPNRHDKAETYSYDPVGNRLTGPEQHTAYLYGAGNELLKKEHTDFSYDNNGNMVAKGHHKHEEKHEGEHRDNDKDDDHHDNGHHDANGWSYSYDFENRLIKAEDKHTTVTFKYDPLGRRIEKKVAKRDKKDDDDSVTHTYVYDGQAIILEYETTGDGRHKKTEATKYVHGPGIDEPLAMTRDNEVYFYHADGLGSVVALTDKKQKVVEAYEYDSFGNLKGGIAPMQPFTYTGRIFDIETGLLDYRARTYDSQLGIFLQKDPSGFDGGINQFSYVGANPVSYRDPSGLVRWTGTSYSGGFVWGGGVSVFNYFLESECVNSEKAVVEVRAIGFSVGFGKKATGTRGSAVFEDYDDRIDPSHFNGSLAVVQAGITFSPKANTGPGGGFGAAYLRLGSAFTPIELGALVGVSVGRDFSVSGTYGVSNLVSCKKMCCN